MYWCRANRHGRRTNGTVCPNNLLVPMKLLDAAILGCIAPYLTPDVIGDAIGEAMKRIGSRAAIATERARLEQELKAVDAEITNLVGFIKRGQASEAVQQELAATEAKRKDLREARDRLSAAETFRRASGDVEARLSAILKDWQDIRTKPVPQQRQLLRKLVPDRIAVTPHVRGGLARVDGTRADRVGHHPVARRRPSIWTSGGGPNGIRTLVGQDLTFPINGVATRHQ